VRVHHSLLVPHNVGIKDISVVYSHPQALAQCRNFLARNELESRPYYDTAGAAAMIGRDRPIGAGAIANEVCSDLYGLKVIEDKIEDSKSNFTRFLVLSKEKGPSKGNKCSITFSTADKAGALTSVLKIFNEAGINLTMIESIPTRDSSGKARFLIDFVIQYPGEEVEAVLERIRSQTSGFNHWVSTGVGQNEIVVMGLGKWVPGWPVPSTKETKWQFMILIRREQARQKGAGFSHQ